ncbi:hypothetical protein [Streptomyces sp. NRRL B-24484]|uniref:hypothetical protein n=1 Tax=Streptomyces sp. NRRL B-24484 TaxID=1463833 RepID=UPI0004C20641|nr:hypothetical protein [Streptomyces sp. NRRL B-24484]
MSNGPSSAQPARTGHEHPEDVRPPADRPGPRMTGEGGPPPPDDQEPEEEAERPAGPADGED